MPEQNKTLKPGWRRVKFGDVVRLSKARSQDPLADGFERYLGLEHLEPGDLRIRSWGNVADGVTFTNVFKPGQVLFGKRRAYQRKVAVAEFAGVCSGDIYVLESKDASVLLPELLPFICQTDAFFEHAVGTSAGSLSPRTNWTSLADFEFNLPLMDEQHRIVTLLDSIEECLISFAEADLATRTLENSHLEDVLASVSVERVIAVEKLVPHGPKNGVSPKANADERGYPTLSIGAVRDGRIVAEGNTKYAEISEAEAAAFELKTNDVLVVRGNGNKLLVGKSGLVDAVPKGCFYPDLLIRLKFDKAIIRPEFAVLQWNSQSTHNRLISRAKSTNGIWKINGADIRQHELKVPEVEEQDALLVEMRAIRAARKEISTRKTEAQKLKQHALRSIESGGANGI
ncbi:restriction endonuclease subunit S [Pseudomonas sp. ABC1]|uniref:restriction endonuclease subunit S n=1 Tax=Pseudomonas sp. ABC1 TaxID=2748080 RepID=UPI0015C2DC5B|nr:restriction endonuclease subunit S [Pseudomonas sp. ABC1]QLF93738.1 restriction endonuclease subunit S [Pseudomonas sp. ABC1]